MNPENKERLDIIRRIAERGKNHNLDSLDNLKFLTVYQLEKRFNSNVDLFQHMLDEIERIN